jgi:hypothetical protein
MIYVITRDLRYFGAIALVFLVASASFFVIIADAKQAFALDQKVIGLAWRELSAACHHIYHHDFSHVVPI